jgi:hypothetical protein
VRPVATSLTVEAQMKDSTERVLVAAIDAAARINEMTECKCSLARP